MSCFGPFMVIATWQLSVFPYQGESYNYSKQVYTIWLVPILDVDFVPERNCVFHLLAIRFPAVIYYKKNCWKFNSRSDWINPLNSVLNNHRFGRSQITNKVRSNPSVLFLLKLLSPRSVSCSLLRNQMATLATQARTVPERRILYLAPPTKEKANE